MKMMTRSLGGALAVVFLTGLFGCGPDKNDPAAGRTPVPLPQPTGTTQAIGEENLVHVWPLSVDHGTIECRRDTELIFTAPDGTAYALNDNAKRAGVADIEPIQRVSGNAKVSLGALRSLAARLCRHT